MRRLKQRDGRSSYSRREFDVCFGLLADIDERLTDVRFTPEGGHLARIVALQLVASLPRAMPFSVDSIGKLNWNSAPCLPSDDAISRPP